MSRSLIGRVLRPALLVALTMVAVQATTAVLAAPVSPSSTTYTRSASCAGLDFYPLDSDTAYSASDSLRYATSSPAWYFLCDPGLPHGAVVTRVRFTLKDVTAGAAVTNCALVRSGLTSSTATTAQVMAHVAGSHDASGPIRLTDSSIAHATIDNASYGYWLQCQLDGSMGQNTGIYGADVTYRISSTKG